MGLWKPRPTYLLSEVYVYRPTLHDVGAILFVKCEKSKLVSVALAGRPATPTKIEPEVTMGFNRRHVKDRK